MPLSVGLLAKRVGCVSFALTPMALPERAERPRVRGFSVLRLRAAAVPQLDLRYVGRTLLHAALVGSLFFVALEVAQRFLLEDLAGYLPLRAHGESVMASTASTPFRPWLLLVL